MIDGFYDECVEFDHSYMTHDINRWIPQTRSECNNLECICCRKLHEDGRCHGNCPLQDSLPDTILKQSQLDIFQGVIA